jgi:hypothetical protein
MKVIPLVRDRLEWMRINPAYVTYIANTSLALGEFTFLFLNKG